MSIPVRVSTGRDAGIREKQGAQSFWSKQQYALGNATNDRKRIFLRFSSLAQQIRGRVVLSATLSARLKTGGNHSVTIAELTEKFDQQTKWNAPQGTTNGEKPAVRGAGQVGPVATSAGDNQRWSIDVTSLVQRVASGTTHYGFRLTSAGTNDRVYYGFESGNAWRLDIELAEDSDAPVSLNPDGGVVGLAKPTLTWAMDEGDPDGPTDGSDQQAAYQVQISTSDSTAGIAYDSGTVQSSANEHVMADYAYSLPAEADRFWRVRVRDLNNNWSDWSDWAETSYVAYPTVTVTSPLMSMYDPSPVIQASVSSAMLQYKVLAYRVADPRTVIYDSGRVSQTAGPITHTIPAKFNESRVFDKLGEQYRLEVRVWDRDDREATPGDLGYVAAESVVTFTAGTGPAPTLLEVEQVGKSSPSVKLRWSLSPTPDKFAVQRGSDVFEVDLADVTQRLGVFSWNDDTAKPGFHEYRVRAVTNGQQGKPSNMISVAVGVRGLWIVRDKANGGQKVCLEGGSPVLEREDSVAEYEPLEGKSALRITYARRHPRGPFTGYLSANFGDYDLDESLAVMRELEANPTETVTLVWAEESIRAKLDDLLVISGDGDGGAQWRINTRVHRVSCVVRKIGEA